MATHRNTTPFGVAATGLPAAPSRLPCRMTLEEEFLALMDLQERTSARLDELVGILTRDPRCRLIDPVLVGASPALVPDDGGRADA